MQPSYVLSFCLALAVVPLAAAPTWTRTPSPYIEIFTTAPAKESTALLQHLDAVRQAFERTEATASARVRVIAFRTPKEYEPWAAIPGVPVYSRGDLQGHVLVLSQTGAAVWPAATREYVRILAASAGVKGPAWLVDGLSEVLAGLRATPASVSAGPPPAQLTQALRKSKLVPLAELTAEPAAGIRETDVANARYRAQTWLVIHMLMLSPGYRERFPEFVRLASSPDALLRVYGKSLADIDRDLTRYARGRLGTAPMGVKTQPVVASAKPAGKLEVGLAFARLAALLQRDDDARKYYGELAAEFPQDGEVAEGRAYLAWRAGDYDSARELLGGLIKKGAGNWAAYYDFARLLQGTPNAQEKIIEVLQKAVELNPAADEARLMLGFESYRALRYADAANALGGIREIPASRRAATLMVLAYAQMQSRTREEARRTGLDALKAALTPAEKSQAEQLLRHIDFDPPEAPLEAGSGGTPLQIRGSLQKVDCLDRSVRLRIVAASRPFHLAIRDKGAVQVRRESGEKSAMLSCGAGQNHSVSVLYIPRHDSELKTVGDVSTLTFLP